MEGMIAENRGVEVYSKVRNQGKCRHCGQSNEGNGAKDWDNIKKGGRLAHRLNAADS